MMSKITNASVKRKLGDSGPMFPIYLLHQIVIKPASHRSRCKVNPVTVSGTFVLPTAPGAKRILYPTRDVPAFVEVGEAGIAVECYAASASCSTRWVRYLD